MTHSPMTYLPTRELVGLKNNPRTITQKDLNILCDSIRENGFYEHRPLAVEKQGDELVVLDGNQRLKAARRLKMKTVPCVIYSDLNEVERNEIIFRGNINNGEWDAALLQSDFEGVDFGSIGLNIELPTPEDNEPDEEDDDEDVLKDDKLEFYHNMLGDFAYPSDNEYGIPVLLTDNQPVHVRLPLTPWGVEGRYKKHISCYHFYVDDYRFERLFKDPINLLKSGCKQIVEPNCSIHDQTPVAYGIFKIYRKRYLARYFQEVGVQVWVDLNVSHRFAEYNLLGVPKGYNAFFTRGVSGWQNHLDINLEMAKRISGLDHPNLNVYGGGQDIEEWCYKHSLYYTPEFISHARK